ncbi:hypothetical protein [Rhodopirellula baltica]
MRLRDRIDHTRFRRRLSLFLDSKIHIVLKLEESSEYHYHGIVYSECETTEASLRTAILKALAKDARHKLDTGAVNLHFEEIRLNEASDLFFYTAKANVDLLKKNKSQKVGMREVFTFGQPYSKPPEELAKLTAKERSNSLLNWLCNRPEVVEWIIDGYVDPHHKNFLWLAFVGKNVSECRYSKETCPQHSDFSDSTALRPKSTRPKRRKFIPRPPDQVIGGPNATINNFL